MSSITFLWKENFNVLPRKLVHRRQGSPELNPQCRVDANIRGLLKAQTKVHERAPTVLSRAHQVGGQNKNHLPQMSFRHRCRPSVCSHFFFSPTPRCLFLHNCLLFPLNYLPIWNPTPCVINTGPPCGTLSKSLYLDEMQLWLTAAWQEDTRL